MITCERVFHSVSNLSRIRGVLANSIYPENVTLENVTLFFNFFPKNVTALNRNVFGVGTVNY